MESVEQPDDKKVEEKKEPEGKKDSTASLTIEEKASLLETRKTKKQ